MRVGTPEAQAKAFQDAYAGDVQPPKEVQLIDAQMPIWRALVRARARDEWTEIDKFHCANLTRCLFDVERISAELRAEGDVIANGRGTLVANPKHALLEVLSRRAVALTKLLHLNANAIIDDTTALTHAREQEKKARDAVAELAAIPNGGDDDLLARPGLQ